MIRDKPTQYHLPKKWAEYLINQSETGMGYQIADIYLKGKTLKNVIILGCSTFNYKNKKLNLDTIEKIIVKERKEQEEKKFQTVSVKKTQTKEDEANYYLIEEYTISKENDLDLAIKAAVITRGEYATLEEGELDNKKVYQVTAYKTQQQLLEAILKGPKHGGKLVPAKGLELKLIEKQDNPDLREELAEDMRRREEAYRRTGDII